MLTFYTKSQVHAGIGQYHGNTLTNLSTDPGPNSNVSVGGSLRPKSKCHTPERLTQPNSDTIYPKTVADITG